MSALAIVAGALLMVGWALSHLVVSAVEEGGAVEGMTEAVLDSPAVLAHLSDELSEATIAMVTTEWVDVEQWGLDVPIRAAVARVVHSDAFATLVQSQMRAARAQISLELTNPDRPPGPLVVRLDVSPLLNDGLGAIPVVGEWAPEVVVAPVPVEVVSADNFEKARTAYGWMRLADTWFLWAGIALFVGGALISARRRWFPAKVFLAMGVLVLTCAAALTLVAPHRIAGWVPGGADGPLGTMTVGILTSPSTSVATGRLWWWGAAALAVAGILALIAARLGHTKV